MNYSEDWMNYRLKYKIEKPINIEHAAMLRDESIRMGDFCSIRGLKELAIYFWKKARIYEIYFEKM